MSQCVCCLELYFPGKPSGVSCIYVDGAHASSKPPVLTRRGTTGLMSRLKLGSSPLSPCNVDRTSRVNPKTTEEMIQAAVKCLCVSQSWRSKLATTTTSSRDVDSGVRVSHQGLCQALWVKDWKELVNTLENLQTQPCVRICTVYFNAVRWVRHSI